jgi:polyphosphate kinase
LGEAVGEQHSLLERAKFLAIVGENLDEFFMIRLARLHGRLRRGRMSAPSASMTRTELLETIRREHLPGLTQ